MVATQLPSAGHPADHPGCSSGLGGGRGWGIRGDFWQRFCCLEQLVVEFWARLEGVFEAVCPYVAVFLGLSGYQVPKCQSAHAPTARGWDGMTTIDRDGGWLQYGRGVKSPERYVSICRFNLAW